MSDALTFTRPNRVATGIDTSDIIWVWRTGSLVPTQLALTISGGDLTMTGGNIYFQKGSNSETGTKDDFDMCFIRNSVEHICLENGLNSMKVDTEFDGDIRKTSLTLNEWLTVDASGNIVSSGKESLDYYTSALLDAGQLDNRYYTETEIDNLLTGYSAIAHTHTVSELTDIQDFYYTETEADTLIGNGVLKCIENEVTVSSDDQLVRYEELCMGTGGEIIMELGASVIVGV
tara:strand:+ start:47 stop:742 length:696 start_codon:yes stop_codon:yes gene_type:complete